MKLRGGSAFIAGERPSLGDFYVAPICFLVSLTQMPAKSSRWMVSPDGGSRYRQCRATKRQHPGLAEI
jgi:hypothetical protein